MSELGKMTEPSTIEEKLELCQTAIGYRFADPRLLQNALTHASGAARRLESNERLEFLGDSILGMVICEQLFTRYPEALEGELTKIKSTIVSRRVCARVARRLELENCLIIGRGMLNGVLPRSLLSDVFEAIIAAVYLDGGLDAVRELIHSTMLAELNAPSTEAVVGNFKSVLQHYGQRELGVTPRYKLLRQFGPDHEKVFAIVAELGPREFAPAFGKSKKDAEQRAACNALAELRGELPPYNDETIT